MNAPLKKPDAPTLAQATNRPDLFSGISTGEMLSSTHTDELVIALCGPIGSPLHEVADKLQEMLRNTFGYQTCRTVRLSKFIEEHARRAGRTVSGKPAERRHALIDVGDEMRRTYGFSVLAELAVHEIRVDRELHARDPATRQYLPRRACHIVDSIKNQHELELLRTVYREALHVVGVFAPVNTREQALRAQGLDNTAIAQLMDRDSGEELDEGQTVQETFPQCDFFLRMDSNTDTQLRGRVERFLHLIGGKCYNDEEKELLATHVVDALGPLVSDSNREAAIQSVKGDKKLRSLIEFSRSIHAEMHAILTALRQKGDRVRGGRIYVTTYPCHSCARHIIATGISEVYYIEPYKKSLATRLHGDAMTESEEAVDKVRLLPYDGVAPTRFLSLFKMKRDSRKHNGKVVRIAPDHGTPKVEKSLEALPALEALVVESLRRKSLVASPPGASASDTAGTTPA